MGRCSISVFLLLFSGLIFVHCDVIINDESADDVARKSLPLILKFLNNEEKASINFSSGSIFNSELKGNNLEVEVLVYITCRIPSEECDDRTANCKSVLHMLPNRELEVLSVRCLPNPPIIEEPLALPVKKQTCTGCLSDININADGVDSLVNIIIQHVQSERNKKYIPLEVLKVQQQVVNGVNFILTVKIAPAICNDVTLECVKDQQEDDTYCLVKFYQKPGYRKPKNLISNNCTKSQTFDPSQSMLESNDVNKIGRSADKYVVHEKDLPLKKLERSENDVIADLVSQIIPYDQFESSQKKDVELVQSNPVRSVESSSVHNLVDENGQPIISSSTFQEVLATEDEPISPGTDTAGEQDVTPINPSSSSHGAASIDIISAPSQNLYSTDQQTENVEVTSQNSGSEHGNGISAPIGTYVSDSLGPPSKRARRSVINSEKFSPREKAAVRNIANFVASTLDTIDDDNHKRVVLEIINVKKIKTDGLFLNMNLRIGVSKCEENDDAAHCREDLLEDLSKFCKVQVLINENFENPKVVKSHCENEKQDSQKSNRTSNVRRKRSLLGGKNKINVDDPKIEQFVKETVNYMNNNLNMGDTPIQVNRVLSATSQVVSGISYDIKVEMSSCDEHENSIDNNCSNASKVCNINVWDRPWMVNRIITIDCGGPKLRFNISRGKNRVTRSVPGGWSQKSIDDPKIIPRLGKILNKMDAQTDKDAKLKIKSLISVSVVAGPNWEIKAKVAFSECSKTQVREPEDCPDSSDPFETVCDFKFLEKYPNRYGLSALDNIQVNCLDAKLNYRHNEEQTRKRRSLVGGHSAITNDDPRILKHVNKLLPELDSLSDKEHKLKIKEILSATTQVVAGTNWNIRAKVQLSDCAKTDEKKVENCGENKQDSFETICTFKFWERLPDRNGVRNLENVQINCDEPKLNFRTKREIQSRKRRTVLVGGHNAVPNDDPSIGKHLSKLLPKLDAQSGKEHKLKIKEIISATSQVVAGTNWNIRAKVGLSDCTKTEDKKVENCEENKQDSFETICTFKFWERLPNENGVRNLENVQINCDEPKLNFRSKREIKSRQRRTVLVGGHNAVPNDDPRIGKHLDKLLPKLDSQSGKEHKLKIKEILSATSQVVAGTNWNIRAKVALSDCAKTEEKKVENCEENKRDHFETICNFKFWERLPNENGVRNLENVQINCDEPKLNFRSKREIQSRQRRTVLVGGHNEVPNDDPSIGKHLNKLLPKLDAQSSKEHKLKIKEIISATSQVVAGTDWNIRAKVALSDCAKTEEKKVENCGENKQDSFETVCTFKFWERLPNENGVRNLENVQINCDEPKLNFRTKREIKSRQRKTVLVGGHNAVPNDDPRIGKHLDKLLPKLDSQSDKKNKLKIKEILSATSQVVAGTNWNIRAKVALSDCAKTEEKKAENCEENKQDHFETICNFEFWERLPNENGFRELENIEIVCDEPKLNYKSKQENHMGLEYQPYLQISHKNEELLGEEYEVDKNDPLIYEFLSKSLQQIDLNSPEDNKFKVKEIISATKKIEDGNLWKIKVRLVLSDCSKNDVTDWEQCGDLQGADPKNCVIQIWDRPWIKRGRETHISCENQKTEYTFRSKRSPQQKGKLSEEDDYDIQFAVFEQFERKYNKHYFSRNERMYRFSVFRENMWYVKQLNKYEQGTATYGPTQFADMTRKEFSQRLGYRADLRNDNEISFPHAEIPDVKLPASFDWRDKNAVAEVKDQGSCGSCWAFSVTGNIEGQYAIKNQQLLEFSEQELVDCDKVDEGCNGGLMDNAYRQIEKLGGLEEEKDYPYDGRNEKCHFNKSLAHVQLSGAVNISSNETDMAKWLLKNGPISIAINANAMQFYVGGVSHPWKFLCNPKNLDHGVLIVGYGVHTYPKFKKSLPYWIVKNSWGTSWGEQGYYRVYRGDGTCGVNQTPSSAILK